MAVKTITIDMDAYEILFRHKKPGQSFSQVIKEHFGNRKTVKQFQAVIREIGISEDALDAISMQVKARGARRSRTAKL